MFCGYSCRAGWSITLCEVAALDLFCFYILRLSSLWIASFHPLDCRADSTSINVLGQLLMSHKTIL